MADQGSEKKKTCFIAMPISTPKHLLEEYGGDADHFRHVMECLFMPAIEAAGMVPISPVSEGSEVIHSEIIAQLQTADLVLVDMSTLNANCFFEFGIRTSLNLPVCVVRDDKTKSIPFDAAPINALTYQSQLHAWLVKAEVPVIAKHLQASFEKSGGKNALWKHFGFKIEAEEAKGPSDEKGKLDLILAELAGLQKNFRPADFSDERQSVIEASAEDATAKKREILFGIVSQLVVLEGWNPESFAIHLPGGDGIEVVLPYVASKEQRNRLQTILRKHFPHRNVSVRKYLHP